MIAKQLLSSKDQTWATPKPFFQKVDAIFHFVLDPCAADETAKCKIYYTKKEDGLTKEWHKLGNSFVNPPFGRELPAWMKKCYDESCKGITVVMLIPARTDTSYWHDYAFKYASCICFIRGRFVFEKSGTDTPRSKWVSAPFPNALVIFGNCTKEQMLQLNQFGKLMEVKADVPTNDGIPPNTKVYGILPTIL